MKKNLTVGLFVAGAISSTSALAEISIKNYGFIKAGLSTTNKGVMSFGVDGFRAPTEAANQKDNVATVPTEDKKSQKSFQSGQSRWGLVIDNSKGVVGKIEVDAAGANGSPDTAVKLRVRQANIAYNTSFGGKFFAGQKWISFAGLVPHTVNMVGANYRAGNSGFIGNELGYTHGFGNVHLTAALGNKGSSTNAGTTDTELGTPSITAKLEYKNDMHHVGAAYITAELEHTSLAATGNKDTDVGGFKGFYSGTFGSFNFKAEYYSGNGLSDLGMLTIGKAASTTDSKKYDESGYFASLKYSMKECAFWVGYGHAEVDKLSDYAQGNLVENTKITVAGEFNLSEGLNAFVNVENFKTAYLTSTANTSADSKATHTELGMIYRF